MATNRCISSSDGRHGRQAVSLGRRIPDLRKLERYHRTFKDFYADHGPADTIDELQALCDRFRWHHNHQRPHQGLNQQITAEVYQALPKVAAGDPRPRWRRPDPASCWFRPLEASTTASARSASESPGKANA